ncbi:MAG: hypothetical protein WC528_00875 [Patescibacteria group bacterium]
MSNYNESVGESLGTGPAESGYEPDLYFRPPATEQDYERFSIADSLDKSFNEIDEMPAMPDIVISPEEIKDISEREALQKYLKEILTELFANSRIKDFRRQTKKEGYTVLSRLEKEEIFRIYDRIKSQAREKIGPLLTPKLLNEVKFITGSDLNHSLRSRILEGGDAEPWMILNPIKKGRFNRLVDYMDSRKLRLFLRNSLSKKGDIKFIRQSVKEGTGTEAMAEVAKDFPDVEEEAAEAK